MYRDRPNARTRSTSPGRAPKPIRFSTCSTLGSDPGRLGLRADAERLGSDPDLAVVAGCDPVPTLTSGCDWIGAATSVAENAIARKAARFICHVRPTRAAERLKNCHTIPPPDGTS